MIHECPFDPLSICRQLVLNIFGFSSSSSDRSTHDYRFQKMVDWSIGDDGCWRWRWWWTTDDQLALLPRWRCVDVLYVRWIDTGRNTRSAWYENLKWHRICLLLLLNAGFGGQLYESDRCHMCTAHIYHDRSGEFSSSHVSWHFCHVDMDGWMAGACVLLFLRRGLGIQIIVRSGSSSRCRCFSSVGIWFLAPSFRLYTFWIAY